MNVWVALIIGIVIGWLAQRAVDWLFWRKEDGPSPEEINLREQLGSLQRRYQGLAEKLQTAETDNVALQGRLEAALNREPEVIIKTVEVLRQKDQLEKIRGIGTVFANRLNEAGVQSFSDLAELTPERVKEIINPRDWQAIDPAAWIEAASQLAGNSGTLRA